jgi:hypothetical protein
MSGTEHKDPSKAWLFFFFVCFILTVFGIGIFAKFTYNVDAPTPQAAGGHGG